MIGVVGSIVGRILFRIIGFAPIHLIGSLISAVVGAVLLLNVLGRLKRSWVACTKEKPPPR